MLIKTTVTRSGLDGPGLELTSRTALGLPLQRVPRPFPGGKATATHVQLVPRLRMNPPVSAVAFCGVINTESPVILNTANTPSKIVKCFVAKQAYIELS
jgi:hypothetical protein